MAIQEYGELTQRLSILTILTKDCPRELMQETSKEWLFYLQESSLLRDNMDYMFTRTINGNRSICLLAVMKSFVISLQKVTLCCSLHALLSI